MKLEKFWQKCMFLVFLCFFVLVMSGCSVEQDNHHNAIVNYGKEDIEVYDEYPFRRLNDLNTHYVMRHGEEVYIEKVVDVTTGNVYYLAMGSDGTVSISPVYDNEGKIMKLPMKE